MDQGRTAEACEKFAESLALEQRGGVLLNLAVCREMQGRYATALRLLHEAREWAAKDGRADRVALAEDHLATVRKKVSWLTVRVLGGADAPALEVRCDDEPLPREGWGTLRAVDPGPHTVSATAPGRPRFEATVLVGEGGDSRTVEIPAPSAAPAIPAALTGAPWIPERAPARATPAAWSTLVGAAILGMGAVVGVTGAAFGVKTIIDVRQSDPSCPHDVCTNDAAFQQNQDAHTAAHVADIAIPTGLAVAGAGLYLLLRRPPPAADATTVHVMPAAAPRAASLTVSASW